MEAKGIVSLKTHSSEFPLSASIPEVCEVSLVAKLRQADVENGSGVSERDYESARPAGH